MNVRRLSAWDIGYLALLVLTIPIVVDYIAHGVWGPLAMTILFLVAGLAALAYSWRRGEEIGPLFPTESVDGDASSRVPRAHRQLERGAAGRPFDWLAMAVTSGFAATGVLTSLLLFSYGVANALGANGPGASLVSRWLWSLTNNPATHTARANLPLALVLNFGAGILWAVVYAAVFEPRLRGTGWERGALFALLPWAVSVLVFLPLVNGGLLGFGFHAGPLPLLGNLILHLAYGGTLGAVYASEDVLTEDGQPESAAEQRELDRTERLIALGLAPGAVIGFLLGLVGSGLIAPSTDPWLVGVLGAIIGCVAGALVGSFVGLTPTEAVEGDPRA